MATANTKPREFWVTVNNQTLKAMAASDAPYKQESKHYTDIHVIEKSAYDKAVEALKKIRKISGQIPGKGTTQAVEINDVYNQTLR